MRNYPAPFQRGRQSDPADDEFVETLVAIHAVTAKAALLSRPAYGEGEDQAIWVPKSQITGAASMRRDTETTIGIKRWFLKKENWA